MKLIKKFMDPRENEPFRRTREKIRFFYSLNIKKYEQIISFSTLVVLLFGVLAGVKLAQIQQDLRSKAKVPVPIERTNLILYFTSNTQEDGKQVVNLESIESNNGYPPNNIENPYLTYTHQLEIIPENPSETIKVIKFSFVNQLEGEIFSPPESKGPPIRKVSNPLKKPEAYIVTSYKSGDRLVVRDLKTNELTPIPQATIDKAVANKRLLDPNPPIQRIFPSVAPESSF